MTIAKFLTGVFASQILFIITKIIFINYLNIDSYFFIAVMWIVLSAITIAIVRRMGVLNYFESFFIAVVWTVFSLVLDLLITTAVTGRDVYRTYYFWLSYLLVILVIIIFHKKAHVQMRRMMREKSR